MLAELALVCLLAGGLPPPAATEAADPALSLGEAFQRSGAFAEAVTEYKRFLFFHPEDARAGEVRSRLGFCLLGEGRLGEGLAALRLAAVGEAGESLDRRLDLVLALLQSGKDAEAELELLRLQAFSGERGGSPLPDLAGQLAEVRGLRLKSPRTARLLSALVPGAGQVYAGDLPDGLNALAVNGGIAVLAAAAAVNGWYPEAALLVIFPLRRYYLGNIGNAGQLAERRNSAARQQVRQRILDALADLLAEEQGE